MRRIIIAVVFAVAAISTLAWSQRRTEAYFVSGFLEVDEMRLGSRVGGRVESVHVEEGQLVETNAVLVTLEPFDFRERLAEANATLAARTAVLEKLRKGYRQEEIDQSAARRDRFAATLEKLSAGMRPLEVQYLADKVTVAKAEAAWAETEHRRIQGLFEKSQAAIEELDEAQRRLDVTRANLAAAQDQLDLAKEGTRKEEIAEAKASLTETTAQLDLMKKGFRAEEIAEAEATAQAASAAVQMIQRRVDELTIRAPRTGVVEAIDLQPGDLVPPDAPVLTLLDTSTLWVRAYVPESRLNLKTNDVVDLRVDAFPQRRFKGRIVVIARQAEFTPSNVQTPEERAKQVFRIKVQVEEGLDVLRAGMSADVFLEPAR